MRAAALAAWLAVMTASACGGAAASESVPGPTRYHRAPVPPSAYAEYIRGRVAVYERDYRAALEAFRRARRAAPTEPELTAALAEAALLYLSAQ